MFDFQHVFGLRWWDEIESGDPDHAELLVAGLLRYPESMYRAAYLRDHPIMEADPSDDPPAKLLDWYGANQLLMMVTRIYNSMMQRKGDQFSLPVAPYESPEDQNQANINWLLTH